MAKAGAERQGTPKYYNAFNGELPNPNYKSGEAEELKQDIKTDFGDLIEFHPHSPRFNVDAVFTPVAYNKELGHALFRGSVGPQLHLVEYVLEDRDRKAFSRRGLVFPISRPTTPVSEAQIMQVDGDFRKIYQFYFNGRRKPNIQTSFTHGGHSDYNGEDLVTAGFTGNKLQNVDFIYKWRLEEGKPQPKAPEVPEREFHPGLDTKEDFWEILASKFAPSGDTAPIYPPDVMRFEPKPSSRLMLTADDYSLTYEQTKRIGEVFNPDWIRPFIVATSHIGGMLRLQRIQRSGAFWHVRAPLEIDNAQVAATALSRGLEWRGLHTILPVSFDMVEPNQTLINIDRRSLS